MNLEKRREHEREKYEALLDPVYNYANGFFGRAAVPIVEKINPRTLVDLGSGRNLFVTAVRERIPGIRAVGCDWVFPESDVKAPMYDTGFDDNQFDMVTSFDALEHLLEEDVPTTFQEMRRIAFPGGHLLVGICYQASVRKSLGEGLHPTVRPKEWWIERIQDVAENIQEISGYILADFKEDN